MNKRKLIASFIAQISKDLESMKSAAQSTYNEATHEESKAENKYDTRGLEASYLAGAQAKRVEELQEILGFFKNFPIKSFSDEDRIALTALIQVRQNEKESFLLLMPKGGGQVIQFENQLVQVITPQSPLGSLLVGKEVNDEVELALGLKKVTYEILSLR